MMTLICWPGVDVHSRTRHFVFEGAGQISCGVEVKKMEEVRTLELDVRGERSELRYPERTVVIYVCIRKRS